MHLLPAIQQIARHQQSSVSSIVGLLKTPPISTVYISEVLVITRAILADTFDG